MESINENASRNYLRVDNNRVGTTRKAAKIKNLLFQIPGKEDGKEEEKTTTKRILSKPTA